MAETPLLPCAEPSHFCVSSPASSPSPLGTMERSSSRHLRRRLIGDLAEDDAELSAASGSLRQRHGNAIEAYSLRTMEAPAKPKSFECGCDHLDRSLISGLAEDDAELLAAFGSAPRQRDGDAIEADSLRAMEAPAKPESFECGCDGGPPPSLAFEPSFHGEECLPWKHAGRGKPSSTDLDREEAWERKKAQYLPEDGNGEDEEYESDEGFSDALSEHSSEGVCSSGCDEASALRLDDKASGKHIRDQDHVHDASHGEDFCTEDRLQKPPRRAPIKIGRPARRAAAKPMRTRSLTDDDLEELRGSIDLGFGFSFNERCKLTSTLPALELYYAINKNYVDARACSSPASPLEGNALLRANSTGSTPSPSSESWRISSPGDHPSQVKTRLRHWAQAVACSVKQGY